MKKTFALILNMLLLAAACRNDKPAPPSPAPDVAAPAYPARQDTLAEVAVPDSLPPSKADVQLDDEKKDLKEKATPPPVKSGTAPAKPAAPAPPKPAVYNDASTFAKKGFSDVEALDPSIKLDIRYATADNFTKAKIYDCPRCLLRPEAAKALVKAHKALQKKGYGLKMYDCYRPRPYQQRLWDKVPNPDYVTPPAKGSMHSRGAAVDLTIVDKQGKELNMGTPYDFFGKEAHTDNTNLPAQVLTNRRMLREALEAVGFKGIRTEWWHFSYQGKDYPLSDYVWPCDNKK